MALIQGEQNSPDTIANCSSVVTSNVILNVKSLARRIFNAFRQPYKSIFLTLFMMIGGGQVRDSFLSI